MQPDLFQPEPPANPTVWERLGMWMVGECERPPELDELKRERIAGSGEGD